MDWKIMFGIAALCIISASGCTSLSSKKLLDQPNISSGLTYRLPAKQFSIKATYEITGCNARETDADIEANVSAILTESLIGAEAYTIDYQQLNAWTKVTNTEFQLSETGLLTGVNASIADQSGSVIQNSVTAAASVVRAVALPSIPTFGTNNFKNNVSNLKSLGFSVGDTVDSKGLSKLFKSSPSILNQLNALDGKQVDSQLQKILNQIKQEAQNPCASVTEALDAKKKAEGDLEKEKESDKDRAKSEQKIRDSALQIKTLNDLVTIYEKLGDEEEKGKLLKRVQLQEKNKEEAEAALKTLGESKTDKILKEISDAKNKLTVVGSKEFLPSVSSRSVEVPVSSTDLKKLFADRLEANQIKLPVVTMTVEKLEINISDENKIPEAKKIGIAYRIPVAAVAKVYCQPNGNNQSPILLVEKSTQVPQFGPIGSINLDNNMFDDNLVELVFNGVTGAPSKLTFRSKSKAEAASATVRDAAGMYLQLQKDKRDDQIYTNKALLDQATGQVTLGKAQSDLALSKVQAEATVAKTEAELQQSLVSAQLQLLRDQQRLDAVRTGTATAAEVELEALNTQEQLLSQRLKILKLEQEIAEQKAKSISSNVP